MKRLYFAIPLLAMMWLASCEAPNDNATSVTRPGPSSNGHGGGGSTTAGDPVIGFAGTVKSHNHDYWAIYLTDTTGSTQTPVYTSGTYGANAPVFSAPFWSPSGAALAFTTTYGLSSAKSTPDTIYTIDISINSSNIPSGSNRQAIVAGASGWRMNSAHWSRTSAKNLIAYTTYDGSVTKLNVVSPSGGTPTTVWETDTNYTHHPHCLGYPSFNSDDSRLAVMRLDSTDGTGVSRAATIMIFNTSDWSYVDSITVSGYVSGVDWSPVANQFALCWAPVGGSSYTIRYCSATTGATLSGSGPSTSCAGWSPNASSLIWSTGSNMYKANAFGTTVTTVSSALKTGAAANTNRFLDWKR